MIPTHSLWEIHKAGFFDDGIDDPLNLTIMEYLDSIIPLKIKSGPRPLVLFTTGAFSPIHNGHLAMMEKAREIAMKEGYTVVGGYITPGHDSYVSSKYDGAASISYHHRLAMAEIATRNSWISVDPLACTYFPAEVNFTTVYSYLKKFLEERIPGVELRYVCGSDNSDFQAVIPTIVVDRTDISSSRVRAGEVDLLDPQVKEYWDKLGVQNSDLPILLRSEWLESVNHLPINDLEKRIGKFQSILKTNFQNLVKSDSKTKVYILNTNTQRKLSEDAIKGRSSISLDPFFDADYHFHVSRVFAPASTQQKALRRVSRVECKKSLEEQAMAIPNGPHVLIEDDSVTGRTIDFVKQYLDIDEVILLSDYSEFKDGQYLDVVDLRDFILGAKFGGLLVEHTNMVRLPYVAPFVNLTSRATIHPTHVVEMSRVIWRANFQLFEGTGLTFENLLSDSFTVENMKILHVEPTDLVEDFCLKMMNIFMEL